MAITDENSPSDGKVWGLFKLPFRNSVNSNPTTSSSSNYNQHSQSQSNGIVDGANGQSSSGSTSVSSVARSLIPIRRRLRLDPANKLYFPYRFQEPSVVKIGALKQVLVFNYIAARRVLTANSLVVTYFCPQDINYKSLMGPETERCRRTDGKLWRCRKDVVPGNKYCEGHMHRGRSRKRVEASEVTLQSSLHTAACSNSHTPTRQQLLVR